MLAARFPLNTYITYNLFLSKHLHVTCLSIYLGLYSETNMTGQEWSDVQTRFLEDMLMSIIAKGRMCPIVSHCSNQRN